MKTVLRLLTLSQSIHALAFNLALAAAIERSGRPTPTITKTIYHTEVQRLSNNYMSYCGRSGGAISNKSAASSIERIVEDESIYAASSTLPAYLLPRKPGGEMPTVSQLPVTGVPGIFNTKEAGPRSSNYAIKHGRTVNPEFGTINTRNANLYNLRVALAPGGYIFVYMPNSTASTFCEGQVERGSDVGPKVRELYLAVLNAKKEVAIPVHGEDVASFCLEFDSTENIDSPMSSKAAESSGATASSSKEKATTTSSSDESSESTRRQSKHTSSKATASEVDSDTSSSTTKSRNSYTEDNGDGSETSEFAKHASTSMISSDPSLITLVSATDIASKTKAKSLSSEASGDTPDAVESSLTLTKRKSTDVESSKSETRTTSHSTKTESKTSEDEQTEDTSSSTPSLKKNHGSHTISTDSDASFTLRATPAALPASTTPDTSTDELFTVSSMNSWYPYISEYLETATDSTLTADSAELSPITTTDSINGVVKLGRRVALTAAVQSTGAEHVPHLTDSSMNYNSYYSWVGTVSTKQLSDHGKTSPTGISVPSTNAAMKRLTSPFLFWRRDNKVRSTEVLNSRMKGSGPDDEPEQEKKEFFNIAVEDKEPTRVIADTTRVKYEEALATELAHKQQDDEMEDDDDDVNDEDEGEANAADEEQTPDEEAEPDMEDNGDEDEEPTSTKSESSHTKTSADHDDDADATPTTGTSADVNDENTPTKSNPADDAEEPTPTFKAIDDTPPEDNGDDLDNDPSTMPFSHKSKANIPSLAAGVSFEFPPTTTTTSSPLHAPTPAPTAKASIPTEPIIWDPDCPQFSTSIMTAPDGLPSTVPMAVGLGCWRAFLPSSLNNKNETSGTAARPLHATPSAGSIFSDAQNRQFGVFCWCVIGFIFVQFL
ncbi:uncharacterized protein ALTATR162_LOCUS9252 [Alternaria atra]|uniref:Uncharacterized protein n=1 Tax=Alternaria atra TaxID=119953 RepID=A0A8J2I930_9PLEO|nr:uncharacterized protein ALTATR162_LOCUS9252 [Alternaria atra]CAG5179427.1 unnamed protein product [Alternaria atra]